jgi:hypothetical protein
MEREKKRAEHQSNAQSRGRYYDEGIHGLPQDHAKALELWHQAGELGVLHHITIWSKKVLSR